MAVEKLDRKRRKNGSIEGNTESRDRYRVGTGFGINRGCDGGREGYRELMFN